MQPAGNLYQQLIARFGSLGLVDDFELIEIDQQDRSVPAVAINTGNGLVDAFLKQTQIRQTGQRVIISKAVNFGLGFLIAGNIEKSADIMADTALVINNGGNGESFGVYPAVFAPIPDFPLPISSAAPHEISYDRRPA